MPTAILNPESVHVWQIDLDVAATEAEMALWRTMLSPEERLREDSFRGAGLRRDYLIAHAALRVILGRCLGIPPASVAFETTAPASKSSTATTVYGPMPKPALAPASSSSKIDLRFNLSHTSGKALVGVTLGRELGIDIERHRPMDDLDGMAETVMSPQELQQWKNLNPNDRKPAFYRLWTRKEAYLKAIGLGLFRDLQDVTVSILPAIFTGPTGEHIQADWLVDDRSGEGKWSVTDILPPEGYAAAVCCEGDQVPPIAFTELPLSELGTP
jgi:4'-phosphopantetheinyl transferase